MNKCGKMWSAVTLLALSLVFSSSCTSSSNDAGDAIGATGSDGAQGTDGNPANDGTDGADGNTGVSGADGATGSGKKCTPDEFQSCSDDRKSEIVCNANGDGFESRSCKDSDGGSTICHPDLGCLACIPGKKRCKNDDETEICKEDGTEWIAGDTCSTQLTGQVCTQSSQGASCVKLCDLSVKAATYMGCEYWGVDLDNAFVPGGSRGYYDAAGSQYAIVVSNPNKKTPANVTVFDSDGQVLYDSSGVALTTEPLMPGELRILNLPRRDVNSTVLAPLAYRVKSDVPITAYQFNPLENVEVFSNDASLLLPENVLDKWYIVMTREQTFEILRSYLTVVATQPGETAVTVTVTAPTLPDNDIPHLEPGESITRQMKQFDVLNIETNKPGSDLTGSVVLATRRVAVFGGSEAANAPNTAHCDISPDEELGVCQYDQETACETPLDCLDFNTCCADHLEHQMFPVKTWGKHYIASHTFPRGEERDIWRIMAAENNTKITTLPPQAVIPVLHSGEWFEFESNKDFEIIADKPILVGQFLAAEDAPEPNVNGIPQPGDAGIGDPAFMLTVPFEQYRRDYVVLAPNQYELDYVNVTAPTGVPVDFDGAPIDPTLFEPIGTGEFSTARFLIEDGAHSVTVADIKCEEDSECFGGTCVEREDGKACKGVKAKIGIIVYGYDQYVSYAYPGGLDLKDLGFLKQPLAGGK